MRRLLVVCLVGVIGFVSYGLVSNKPSKIVLVDGQAFATSGMPSMFMVSLTIQNSGASDVLLSVSSPAAQMITLVNPGHDGAAMTVPKQADGILAMDGAHVMLRADDFSEGGFIPLTLTFADAGEISTRIRHAGVTLMSHDASDGVTVQPAPQVSLRVLDAPDGDGVGLRLEVKDFTFHRGADDAVHVAGLGHAHLYLNGLKLGRLYAPEFQIGALRVGRYEIEVVLNANDHRAYVDESGEPISVRLELNIAE